MALASFFIMMMFITLEISPVLVKLISSVGPYDYLLDKTENDYRLYSKEKIEKGNAGTDFRIEDFKNNFGKMRRYKTNFRFVFLLKTCYNSHCKNSRKCKSL
jgi:hypothetical protein